MCRTADVTIVEVGSAEQLEQALAIRVAVFVDEQGVSRALEIDGQDAGARHLLALRHGNPIGTLRVRWLDGGRTAKIERVAVLPEARGARIGRALLEAALALAASAGANTASLHAQIAARGFYGKLGFVAFGPEFIEDSIPHVAMQISLHAAAVPERRPQSAAPPSGRRRRACSGPAQERTPCLDGGMGATYSRGAECHRTVAAPPEMAVTSEARPGFPYPRTWVMMGHKAGDNSQILALAEGLGWPFEIKHLVYRPTELLTNLLAPLTLLGIVSAKSSPLVPPWPDLIISAGRRNEPPCRWIQAHADKRVRLVHVGRPWARIENFDLVVTTPQYRLPKRPNVLHNTAPLQRVADQRLREAARVWAPRLAHLPRPYVAVMVGGNAGPYVLDREAATLLGRAASAFARARGGSLLISTSARTPKQAIPALEAALDCPADFFRWSRDAAENPYLGYLALADSIIVTCESMSMLTEACATLKPVYMFDLHTGPENRWGLLESLIGKVDTSWWRRIRRLQLQPLVFRIAFVIGPTRMTRDVRIIHRQLQAQGRAVWLGEPFPEGPTPTPLDDVPRAVARVKALFEESVGAPCRAARGIRDSAGARVDPHTEPAAL